MNSRYLITGSTVVLALLVTMTAHAQSVERGRTVRSSEAVRLAMERNPTLRATALAKERAGSEVSAEEGLYPFVLELDGGYTHASSPSAAADGDIAHYASDEVAVGSGISKTLPVGTAMALRVEGNRQVGDGPVPAGGDTGASDPTYGMQAKLSITQPLLRGAGTTVGRASLRQALGAEEIARCGERRAASGLVRDVLNTYWELWYASRALEIDARARDVAQAQLEEARDKVVKGAAARVDVLPFETRLAALEEAVVAAESEAQRLAVELAAQIGLASEVPRVMPDSAEEPPIGAADPALDESLRAAVADAPEVREGAAKLAAAEDKTRTAGEEMRQRLDLVGWVQAQTLGDNEIPPVFEQLGEGGAYSGYVGLAYEIPLDNTRKAAERAAANLDVEIARQQLLAASDQARADAAKAWERLAGARRRLALAEQTLRVAGQQAAAERERLALGAAIFVQVRDAEEAVREAKLRVARARIDIAEARISLDHLTGRLHPRGSN